MNDCVNKNWTGPDDTHAGGVSYGPGFAISWQRGPLGESGRNGAFLIDVLEACQNQLEYFQSGKFECPENQEALLHLNNAISALKSRRARRQNEGVWGTHRV